MSSIVKWFSLLLLLIFSFGNFDTIGAQQPAECQNWEIFKDELCYTLFSRIDHYAYENGERQCTSYYQASYLLIRSQIEQDAVKNYLFTKSRVVNNVWLAAKYYPFEKKFKWSDGTDLTYTNWQAGYPKLDLITDYCVQLSSDQKNLGKWIDVPCIQQALVVCQKEQTWSNAYLKTVVQPIRANPLPIDFVYVQLPKQKSPIELYPELTWTDLTAQYGGLFPGGHATRNDSMTGFVIKIWKRTA